MVRDRTAAAGSGDQKQQYHGDGPNRQEIDKQQFRRSPLKDGQKGPVEKDQAQTEQEQVTFRLSQKMAESSHVDSPPVEASLRPAAKSTMVCLLINRKQRRDKVKSEQ
jgi:hypothetical protein